MKSVTNTTHCVVTIISLISCAWHTLKTQRSICALRQPVLASKAMGIACRMVIAWSTSSLRRKWGGEPVQAWQGSTEERENIQWITWDYLNSIQWILIEHLLCTMHNKRNNILTELKITVSAGVITPHTCLFVCLFVSKDPFGES